VVYASIRNAMRSQVWAIMPDKLEAIMAFLQLKAEGKHADAATIAEIHAASEVMAVRAQKVSAASSGAVAVLPLYGMILHRGSTMGDISGPSATSVQKFTDQFRQAVNDPNVSAIVIDVDSPGGTVEGVDELASEIRASRGKKKTIAVSNCLNASAAYYISSACTEIVVSPSSLTGSIGVYSAHEDDSEYLAKMGVKISLISYGENKTQGNPYEPLSDTGRANMQDMVNAFGAMFEKAVAAGRKISVAKVHETFGQGLVFGAKKAVALGMADSIGTLDDVLSRFGVTRGGGSTQMSGSQAIQAALPPRADDSDEPTCRNSAGEPCDASDPDCDQEQSDDGCVCDSTSAKAKALRRRQQLALAEI
jgi:signal peptide peptidase SppA